MFELFNRPDDVATWRTAVDGGKPDWPIFFEGWSAAVDWPVAAYFDQLAEAFPDALVVLTVRDPQHWWKSFSKLLGLVLKTRLFNFIPMFRKFAAMNMHMIDYVFDGSMDDKSLATSV